MTIKGIQKVTLLDYPGRVACTIFTGGCNFHCPFCQNSSLVIQTDNHYLPEEEVIEFLKTRQNKLDAVCISGGEPLIQKDILEFIKKIKELGFLVKLDTNGSFPEKLSELLKEHLLDYVAMDIKNVMAKYPETSGVKTDTTKIQKSIELLKNSHIEHEFRTTVVKDFHTKEDMLKIARLTNPSPLYFQQFRDSSSVIKEGLQGYSDLEIKELVEEISKSFKNVSLRGV